MKNQSVLAIACVLAAGCSWGPPDPVVEEQLAELRSELAQVRAQLVTMQADVDLQAEAVTAALADPATPKARQVARRPNDVDADLGDALDQLDDHAHELEQLQLEVKAVSEVLNAHATELDQQSDALTDLDSQTTGLRTLEGTLSFEDGRVVVHGADLLLEPGKNPDGSPRPAGQILNQAP